MRLTRRRYSRWLDRQRLQFAGRLRLRPDEVSDEEVARAIRAVPTHRGNATHHSDYSTAFGSGSVAFTVTETDGNLLYAAVAAYFSSPPTISGPAGWTQAGASPITVGSNVRFSLWSRTASGDGGGTTYTWTVGAGQIGGLIVSWSGVGTGASTPTSGTGTGSSYTTGSLTCADSTYAVLSFGLTPSATAPTGSFNSQTASVINGSVTALDGSYSVGAGPGPYSCTWTGYTGTYGAYMIAIPGVVPAIFDDEDLLWKVATAW